MLDLEDQGGILDGVTRLYGVDPFTTSSIRSLIDRESKQHGALLIARYI